MKREISLIAAAMLLGAYLGMVVFPLLWSEDAPASASALLTIEEAKGLEELDNKLALFKDNLPLVKTFLVVLSVSAFALLFLNLNRNVGRGLPGRRGARLKALAAFALFAGCFILMAAVTEGMSYLGGARGAIKSILFVLLFGLAWYVAGEMGWAGDFSRWRGRGEAPGRIAETRSGIFMGLAVGGTAWALVLLGDRASACYLALAAGVLAGSPVPSWRGLVFTSLGISFMLVASFGVLAGVAIALAPVRRSLRERLWRLAFPSALLALYLAAMLAVYLNSRTQYDLGNGSLSEAAGLGDGAPESLALIVLKPSDESSAFMLQRWPMEFSSFEGYAPGTVAATHGNMERLEEYLFRRAGISAFAGQAHEALYRGYFVLWDAERAMERLFASAERLMLARLLLLERLQFAPVTRKNLLYLRSFADETRWHAGPEAALGLARGFAHFGMNPEARHWLERAGEGRGPDTIGEAGQAALTTGRIRGRITMDGSPPSETIVTLFREHDIARELDDFSLARWLIDTRAPDENGFFQFENLGEGQYFLAIVAPEGALPNDTPPQDLGIENLPGVFELSKEAPGADLGGIAINIAHEVPRANRD